MNIRNSTPNSASIATSSLFGNVNQPSQWRSTAMRPRPGAEQGADGEEAQHRVDAQALQRGDQDAGEGEEQEDFPQKGEGVLLLHGRTSVMTNRSIVNET